MSDIYLQQHTQIDHTTTTTSTPLHSMQTRSRTGREVLMTTVDGQITSDLAHYSKDIKLPESVQRRATNLINGMEKLHHEKKDVWGR